MKGIASTRRVVLGCLALLGQAAAAIDVPESGATWATNVHRLGVNGSNVLVAFVEGLDSRTGGYRINPTPTNGWYQYWPSSNIFNGKVFTYHDDGSPGNTNYSPHATGVAELGVGLRLSVYWMPGYIGIAYGATNIHNYSANYFGNVYMASNLAPTGDCFSFAYVSGTSDQISASAQLDALADNHGKIFVLGLPPTNYGALYGGDHPAGIAASYNGITVGCSDGNYTNWGGGARSQYGPSWGFGTAKPDLLTAYYSGSEAAGRGVGDAALLLQQAAQAGLANGSDPRVIKAILLAGARKTIPWDKGNPGADDDHSVPLDYRAGAGIAHCLNNYGIMYGGEVSPGSTNVRAAWDFGSVDTTSRTNAYYFDVRQSNTYLSAAVAWHRHVGAGYTNLQNLDLRLHSASGTTLVAELDWSTSQVDSVEHIWYAVPETGRYAVVVDGRQITASETYGLAFRLAGSNNAALFDEDADGVADEYERQHFGDFFFYGGTNDPDQDGAGNYEEYVADTIPTSTLSRFAISLDRDTNSAVVVTYSSSTARQYAVDCNSGFATNPSAWILATTQYITGSGSQTNWIDDGSQTGEHPSTATSRVYRMHVRIP